MRLGGLWDGPGCSSRSLGALGEPLMGGRSRGDTGGDQGAWAISEGHQGIRRGSGIVLDVAAASAAS